MRPAWQILVECDQHGSNLSDALFHQSSGHRGARPPSQYRYTTSETLLSAKNVPEFTCPYTVAGDSRLSHDRSGSGTMPGKCELSQSVEPGGACRLSLARSTVVSNKCTLVPALCREGLFLVYC